MNREEFYKNKKNYSFNRSYSMQCFINQSQYCLCDEKNFLALHKVV